MTIQVYPMGKARNKKILCCIKAPADQPHGSLKCMFCRLGFGQGEKEILGTMKKKPMTKAFRLSGTHKVNMEKESAEIHAMNGKYQTKTKELSKKLSELCGL